ncbi:hypothetical protein A3L11_10815 [Thermococcus siculi]|uniref:Uncharacterized protein n=1 Tax=Thermococcus siculi TaxID=72803 RepID=A0A2Z2MPC0_9EURY|nr:hypothetical protein A3L11_10815 [Thermococcus siculi]
MGLLEGLPPFRTTVREPSPFSAFSTSKESPAVMKVLITAIVRLGASSGVLEEPEYPAAMAKAPRNARGSRRGMGREFEGDSPNPLHQRGSAVNNSPTRIGTLSSFKTSSTTEEGISTVRFPFPVAWA